MFFHGNDENVKKQAYLCVQIPELYPFFNANIYHQCIVFPKKNYVLNAPQVSQFLLHIWRYQRVHSNLWLTLFLIFFSFLVEQIRKCGAARRELKNKTDEPSQLWCIQLCIAGMCFVDECIQIYTETGWQGLWYWMQTNTKNKNNMPFKWIYVQCFVR